MSARTTRRPAPDRRSRQSYRSRTMQLLVDLVDRPDTDHVNIQIWYNGGFPRTHRVTVGFLRRLETFLNKRPKLDVEWRLM